MKKTILIIVENASFPEDVRVSSEASALYAHGYDVIVLCPRDKQYTRAFEIIDGVHVYRHPATKQRSGLFGYLLEYTSALFWEFIYAWRIYFKEGFDIIQGCNPPDNIFLVALPFKLLGIPYIFDHHDVVPELYIAKDMKKGLVYKCQCWLEKLTFFFSDVVISTNDSYRDVAIARGNVNPSDIFVVRNGPNLKRVKRFPCNDSLKYGKQYLIGYVGWMDVQDSVDILLDVAVQIKTLGRRDIHFTCVGDGPQLATLQQLVREKDLTDMVDFTGLISDSDLMEILSSADVCVNPDKPCPMNDISTMIKIMEYMALGKPIVQFDVKEGRVSAGDASLYVSNDDYITDFATKLLWLLDKPEERIRMGEYGRLRVENELAWRYSIPNLLAAYDRAVFKRRSGPKVEPASIRAD
jgi:glycosyltransferase involved in cell wall biosynthesis